ncbi:MAG: ATP-binding protein [Chlorobi bacterium]|nr:ATP-binding protein [Chlorobiota bacterium]
MEYVGMRLLMEKELSSDLINAMEEVDKISNWVARELGQSHEFLGRFLTGFMEAMNNAIKHGNKEDPNKRVKVRVSLSEDDHAVLEIEDEGNGFDYETVLKQSGVIDIEAESGRGIFLMQKMADDIEFFNGGRGVRLKFAINKGV